LELTKLGPMFKLGFGVVLGPCLVTFPKSLSDAGQVRLLSGLVPVWSSLRVKS
uniref:Uncharacterized protein n=1 Tax=Cannabis sativa TaxID=3483 RepID=A0A803QRU7_CANSA